MKSDARLFADHISALLGPHDSIRVLQPTRAGLLPICCFIFHNRPEQEMMTAVTYGLSLSEHPDWSGDKPELIACVRSSDEEWGLALAGFAERMRGEHSFADGSILMGPTPIAAESEIGGFLLGAQHIVANPARIELSNGWVQLLGAYPIYECEAEFIAQIGPKEFLARPMVDFRNVEREHIWK